MPAEYNRLKNFSLFFSFLRRGGGGGGLGLRSEKEKETDSIMTCVMNNMEIG